MDRVDVDEWLEAYVAAWKRYDRDEIGALFSADVEYRYHPYDEPLRGRDAIAESWLDDRDAPGSWDATYRPLMFDGDRAIATGETRYADGNVFSNLFVLRFDGDGRCTEFVEYYVQHPKEPATA
jgi:ketosteroid isomerase-like protein